MEVDKLLADMYVARRGRRFRGYLVFGRLIWLSFLSMIGWCSLVCVTLLMAWPLSLYRFELARDLPVCPLCKHCKYRTVSMVLAVYGAKAQKIR